MSNKKNYRALIAFVSMLLLVSCGDPATSNTSETNFFRTDELNENYYSLGTHSDCRYLKSSGDVNVLVIPVAISGYDNYVTETNRERIRKVFFADSEDTSWESVSSYYYKSSYDALTIIGTVSEWYNPRLTKSEIESHAMQGADDGGTIYMAENALDWYKSNHSDIDWGKFDSDRDGFVDALYLIYGCPTDGGTFWAFVNWDTYSSPDVFSPMVNCYSWASIDFISEGYGADGIDAHTFIHETGHVLGLDDYYNYDDDGGSPMGAIDMMDNNIIDHDAFSKMALGWMKPYVVSGPSSITIKKASEYGDAIILSPGWGNSCFDEYLLLEFYTPDGLNAKDSENAYGGVRGFTNPGIRLYHVDARFAYENQYLSSYVPGATIGNSNSPSYCLNPSYRLINAISKDKRSFLSFSYIQANNNSLFYEGDSFAISEYANLFPNGPKKGDSEAYDCFNNGSSVEYSFTVASIDEDSATLTFTLV